MPFNKLVVVIGISLLGYNSNILAMSLSNSKLTYMTMRINNIKQQTNIIISNITREIITANKITEQNFNRFALNENNFGANLYFKKGKNKHNTWYNYCIDTSVKYNIYKQHILVSGAFNHLNCQLENNNITQKFITIATSKISLYTYIDAILTVIAHNTTQYEDNSKRQQSHTYGAAYSFYHDFYINSLIAQIMLTVRYLDINTHINTTDKNRLYLTTIGPIIAIQNSYIPIENYIITLGVELGYLKTIAANKQSSITTMVKSNALKILKDIDAQNDWYVVSSLTLKHKNVIFGIEASCDHDNHKTLYGASTYIKYKF